MPAAISLRKRAGGGDSMPFKSKAQRRKFAELLVKGEISPETFEEWNRETGDAELPERASTGAGGKAKKSTKASAKRGKAKAASKTKTRRSVKAAKKPAARAKRKAR